jgi:hypothetical protein
MSVTGTFNDGREPERIRRGRLTPTIFPVLQARAWRVRSAGLELPAEALDGLPAAPPRPAGETVFPRAESPPGYQRAIEWRFVDGAFDKPGPATVWARPRVPLVAGEESSPLQRQMLLADPGNGLSMLLDLRHWWFINTELTAHLHRRPVGEWVGLHARTALSGQGCGLAETTLFDSSGAVGRGAQALLVGPRT